MGVSVKRITDKMLEIHWKKPEKDLCTMDVTAYDVSVVIFDEVRHKYRYIYNTTKTTGFNVTNLKPKCEYNVTVRAKTVAGPGPFTAPYIITFTPADGMCYVLIVPMDIASSLYKPYLAFYQTQTITLILYLILLNSSLASYLFFESF